MRFYVRRDSQSSIDGPFTLDEIRQQLSSKRLRLTSHAIEAKGQSFGQLKNSPEWQTLEALVGSDLPTSTSPQPINTRATAGQKISRRYRDAYGVADAAIALGSVVKGLGILLALFFTVAGFLAASQARDFMGIPMVGVGIVFAVGFGGAAFLLGVLISAQGQILQASLDTAVNTSPFLTDEQRSQALALT